MLNDLKHVDNYQIRLFNYIVTSNSIILVALKTGVQRQRDHNTVADLRGREGRVPSPLAQNFFIFMQFSGKIGQIIGWRPPSLGLAPPPLGNPGSATAICNAVSTCVKHVKFTLHFNMCFNVYLYVSDFSNIYAPIRRRGFMKDLDVGRSLCAQKKCE